MQKAFHSKIGDPVDLTMVEGILIKKNSEKIFNELNEPKRCTYTTKFGWVSAPKVYR